MHPVFTEHDRDAFEVVAYSSVKAGDSMTDQFAMAADTSRLVAITTSGKSLLR